MYATLSQTSEGFERLSWAEIEPWYRELTATALTQDGLQLWLSQWSRLSELVDETMMRNEIACTQNTADEERVQRKQRFLEDIYTHVQVFDQQIKQQLLSSRLKPTSFEIPLHNLHSEAVLFREANVPLLNEEKGLNTEYMEIGGAQTVMWEGKEVPLTSLYSIVADPERARREQAWRAIEKRQLADRDKYNALWVRDVQLRQQIARNAAYENYRDYRWQQLLRFDYTPSDCKAFHAAVEQIIVPVASQFWDKRRRLLAVETIRPWDTWVDPRSNIAPRPISDISALLQQCAAVFRDIDAQLGAYFEIMIQEQLLDLEERPAKAHGGYSLPLEVKRRPFIFGHVRTVQDIVGLIFHEAGHAFHTFEVGHLPYIHQRKEGAVPIEFAEVASTSMEYIGSMFLASSGICSESEAARLRMQHLESMLTDLLPFIVQGDAFQHWVYEHPEQAIHPEKCDEKWAELARHLQPDIDWSGLDTELRSGWQRISHFYCDPFYFIEYAFAALGAIQVWNNYLRDPQTAIQQYRHALSLGATKTVPELYAAAGAKFAFDAAILQLMVQLVTQTFEELEAKG